MLSKYMNSAEISLDAPQGETRGAVEINVAQQQVPYLAFRRTRFGSKCSRGTAKVKIS